MRLTPDGECYFLMADRRPVPEPYAFRWMLPALLGKNMSAWRAVAVGSAALLFPTQIWYAMSQGVGFWAAATSATLLVSLPIITRQIRYMPVLVDSPSMAIALLAAVLPWPYNLMCAFLGSTVRETVPVWGAVYAGDPILLIGLLGVALSYAFRRSDAFVSPRVRSVLRHPWRFARETHAGIWRNPRAMIFPWGGCLAAAAFPSWHLAIAVALAYSQMLRANDTVRLYMMAAPVVAAHAALVPEQLLVPLLLLHVFWPTPKAPV